jgi:hypothetical protein
MEDNNQTLSAEEQAFVDSLGSTAPQEGDPAPSGQEPAPAEPQEPEGSTEGQEPEPQNNSGDDPDVDALLGDDPKDANKAFASMRIKNKELTGIVNSIASVIGLDPAQMSADELKTAMNQAILEAQSKQTNIPTEFLERLNYLENQNKEREAERYHAEARNGLLAIKQQYGASQEELTEFLSNLAQDGIDPMHQAVDLATEYVKRNFDKVVAAQVEAKVNAELERRDKAATQASTPNNSTSKAPENGAEINSVKDFERALNNLTL